ncbi:MAG: LysM peptidoglycan-binding domain-containing protein [Verrucomicrobia bacterium]|nr:LysM peptidoglycan-binding domain-containing protein [Verrucomicrobiota bacterium]
MNTPSPLIPQGSVPPEAKGRSNLRLVVFGIIAVHAVFFGGLLIQGCKPKEDKPKADTAAVTPPQGLPPVDAPPSTPPPATVAPPTLPPPPAVPVTPVVSPPAPQPPTPPDTAPAPSTREHLVTKGENFTTIAKKYNVPLSAIAKANPGVDPTKLQIKQKLVIPAPSASAATPADAVSADIYVVKSGDTLEKIAKSHKTTVKAIQEANGLKTTRIVVNQKLKMPAGAKADAPAPDVATPPAVPKTI